MRTQRLKHQNTFRLGDSESDLDFTLEFTDEYHSLLYCFSFGLLHLLIMDH